MENSYARPHYGKTSTLRVCSNIQISLWERKHSVSALWEYFYNRQNHKNELIILFTGSRRRCWRSPTWQRRTGESTLAGADHDEDDGDHDDDDESLLLSSLLFLGRMRCVFVQSKHNLLEHRKSQIVQVHTWYLTFFIVRLASKRRFLSTGRVSQFR